MIQTTKKYLNVFFWPSWPNNPYQVLLAHALEPLGVKVEIVPSSNRLLRAGVQEQQPAYLHFHSLYYLFTAPKPFIAWLRSIKALFWLLTLRLSGKTLIWTVHDLQNHDDRNPWVDWFFSFCFSRLAQGIILHSERIQQQFVQRFRIAETRKLYVIPHGHYLECYPNHIQPSEARHSLNLRKDQLTFLFLGLIRPYKGVPELISAFQSLSTESAQLAIAGKPASEEIGNQIRDAIQDDCNIHLWPTYIEEDQIQVYMNAADVVVFPYRRVLTSGSIVLAMSFGRACIAPQEGGIQDVLDSSGAFLYDSRQPIGLAQAMQASIENRELLATMGTYNRQKVQQWSWQDIAQQTHAVYQASVSAGKIL
ncbi:GDP-mannose:glycolipid 4-beta-D-mannosyltransferase [Acaryochloris thomasi RCC1774]|uniref:GDP-mannose:glycolipid 4-beta-D-mannosyltransferase n=1 Tax=Acaryochloris thomasi RCC1774 TaxID=1764569 RepID=A0A2W1K280_9CYAN|nr:glycosyltransferase family 4 protein [Acaryochloris thomasi]PZD74197.1 GDP-mannose:glycolipid 4-beta-D-mannosyltransferase [Acaryochloris thomasi RCC1774]